MTPPLCKCAHPYRLHGRNGTCYGTLCACSRYRAGTPAPTTDLPAYATFRAVQRVRGSAEALELAASVRRHPAGKGQKENTDGSR